MLDAPSSSGTKSSDRCTATSGRTTPPACDQSHVLALDGVYTEGADGKLSFHALPTPTAAEVSEIAERTAKRLHEAFQKQGRVSPWDDAAAPVDAELTESDSSGAQTGGCCQTP